MIGGLAKMGERIANGELQQNTYSKAQMKEIK
jgi:hypothetical protein